MLLNEKHFTLDRSLSGPDHQASIEPQELRALILQIRMVEKAMGDGIKAPAEVEMLNIPAMRKSVVAAVNIPAGTVLSTANLSLKRPGTGLAPKWYEIVIGARAKVDLLPDQIIELEQLEFGLKS